MTAWDGSFQTPRVGLLQPGLRADECDKPVERSTEKLVLDSYCTTVRLWADADPEIPRGRLEEAFAVTAAGRQAVSQLTIETQMVSRHIEQRTEPGRQDAVDTHPLPDGTPLTVVPLEDATFPAAPVTNEHRLPGGESLHPCGVCNASGHLDCQSCGQTGRVACGSCGGQKRLRCGSCNGVGARRLPNGVVVNCPACATRGFVVCTACGADGHITCGTCAGHGYVTCGTCDGFARVCRYHVLVSQIGTLTESVFHFAESWPVDMETLAKDMEDVWQEVATLESVDVVGGITSCDIDSYSPPVAARMRGRLQDALRAAVGRGEVEDLRGTTATAVRFLVRGCYVHRVGYSLDGKDAHDFIYIGGLGNKIAPGEIREKCRSSTAWLQRPFHSLLKGIGILESTGPSSRFKARLKETGGKVHLLDTNAVVADAAESLGLKVEVTDYGYLLFNREERAFAEVELTHDAKQENLVVGFVAKLGEAPRDKFVTALEFNAPLVFGRVGLAMNSDTGKLEFSVYDTRVYADLTAEMYAAVLRFLVEAAIPQATAELRE